MRFLWLCLIGILTGVRGCCPSLWGSQAEQASYRSYGRTDGFFVDTTVAMSSSSCSSLSSTPIKMPKYELVVIPGTVEPSAETESERFSSASSTSASSSVTPTVLSDRQCRQKFNFVCKLPITKSPAWGKLAAYKVYPRLQKARSEIVAVVYCCQAHGNIGALIDAGTGLELASLEGVAITSPTDFYAMEVTADNATLIVAAGNTIHLFDAQTGRLRECVQLAADKQITQFVPSKSGVFLLGFSDETVAMVHYGQDSCEPHMLSYPATYMALSRDGSLSAFIGNSAILRVFDTKTGSCVSALTLERSPGVTALALENTTLVVACGKEASLFTGSSGFHLQQTFKFTSAIVKVAIDPHGRYIAFALADQTVYLYAGTTSPVIVDASGDITELVFQENELKIFSVNTRLVRRIHGIDLAHRFAHVFYAEAFHEPSERVSYGNLFAVHETYFGDLVCSLFRGEEDGVEGFVKTISAMPNRLIFLSDLPEYEQKIWEQFSSFTQRALVTKFPLFILDPMQATFIKALIKRMSSIDELSLYRLSESEETMFASCHLAVQEKLAEDYPCLLHNHPQDIFAQMLDSRVLSVTEYSRFMDLRQPVRESIVQHNPNIIASDVCLFRAFWRIIDAIGLGRFSRRSVRIGTGVLLLAALGIGAWRVWVKYYK